MQFLSYCNFLLDDKKDEKNKFFKYFWRILVRFEEKILQICKNRWLLVTWTPYFILHTSLFHHSLQRKAYRNSYLITRTFITLNFILIITLSPFRFSAIKSQLQLFPFLHTIYKILISFLACCCHDIHSTDSILKSTHSPYFQNKKTDGSLWERKTFIF